MLTKLADTLIVRKNDPLFQFTSKLQQKNWFYSWSVPYAGFNPRLFCKGWIDLIVGLYIEPYIKENFKLVRGKFEIRAC